jgi:hypothetical protein
MATIAINAEPRGYQYGRGTYVTGQLTLDSSIAERQQVVGFGQEETILRPGAIGVGTPHIVGAIGSSRCGVFNTTLDGDEAGLPDPIWVDSEFEKSALFSPAGPHGAILSNVSDFTAMLDRVNARDYRGTAFGCFGLMSNLNIKQCYIGVTMFLTDSHLANSVIEKTRDCGVLIPANATNTVNTAVHSYGSRISVMNQGGQGFRSLNCTYADSYFGYFGGSSSQGSWLSQFTNGFFQHNQFRDILLLNGFVTFSNCRVYVQRETEVAEAGISNDDETGPGIGWSLGSFSGKVGVDVRSNNVRMSECVVSLVDYKHSASVASDVGARGIVLNGSATSFAFLGGIISESSPDPGCIGIDITGSPTGIRVDTDVAGFGGSTDRILRVAGTGIRNCDFIFRGDQSDLLSNPGKYIDLDNGWKTAGYNNSVTLIYRPTGESLPLVNQAY